jgi:hypothetical protein
MVARVDDVGADDLALLAAGLQASAPTLAAIGPVKTLPDVHQIASRLSNRQSVVGF